MTGWISLDGAGWVVVDMVRRIEVETWNLNVLRVEERSDVLIIREKVGW